MRIRLCSMTATALSWCIPVHKKLSLREIVLFGMLGALTFSAKLAMAGLYNIEPVSLFVMLFAVTFGKKCVYPIYTYVAMEYLIYGFNLWSVNYLYIWAILAFIAWMMRDMEHPLGWAVLSGGFGLMFGLLCAPVYLFSGGLGYAIAWWSNGIIADLLHCAGNFVIALVLFVPMRKLLHKLYSNIAR